MFGGGGSPLLLLSLFLLLLLLDPGQTAPFCQQSGRLLSVCGAADAAARWRARRL